MRETLWRLPLGLLAGALGFFIFPTENIWIIAPLVVTFATLSVIGASPLLGFLIGFVTGQAFYISHVEWLSLYLGPVPLLALSTLMAIYFGLGMALTAWLYRKFRVSGKNAFGFAFLAAGVWTLREFVANNFPYGGFPWSRLAMTQSDSFLANWVWLGGMSLLTFVVAILGTLFAMWLRHRGGKLKSRSFAVAGLAVILLPLVVPIGLTTQQSGERVIAAVQGNANAGLFSNVSPGTILQNHLDATELIFESELADEIELLVWPENASDVDPLRSAAAREKIEELAERVGAPFTFGTITQAGDDTYNSTLLWEAGKGLVDQYDKKVPVPFAEYAPDREFWRLFAPELVDMIPRGFSFGSRDGLFELNGFTAGTLICFEIAEDSILRELSNQGAEVILSQTNNADFGYSDETYQQAAIARLRAIETGRAVVNISTVGLSVIYLPDGSVLDQVQWYEPAAMVQRVPTFTGLTPGVWVGSAFDWINALIVLGASALAFGRRSA
jgi:apolipoprotein N-acyltransferase